MLSTRFLAFYKPLSCTKYDVKTKAISLPHESFLYLGLALALFSMLAVNLVVSVFEKSLYEQ